MSDKKVRFHTTFPIDFVHSMKIEAMKKGIPVNQLIMEVFQERDQKEKGTK